MLKTPDQDSDDEPPTAQMQQASLTGQSESELEKLQDRQRIAVQRAKERSANVHPDLQDLNFGEIGASSS